MSSWSRRPRPFAAAAIALTLTIAATPAAVLAAEPTPADKATARDAFLAGMGLRAKKDHKGALEKFKVAYALLPTPITALEVGRSLVDLGQLVEGNERLLEAANMPPKPNESADAKRARGEAKLLADQVEPRIPSIKIIVEGAPPGATLLVAIDGRDVPSDALAAARKVNPGKHSVVARVEDGAPTEKIVEVAEGERRDVRIAVKARAVTKRAKEGEGRRRDGAPPAAVEGRGTSTWTYVGFTVAGVGLVVGGVATFGAASKASDLDGACLDGRCPTGVSGTVDAFHTYRNVAIGSFALSLVGLGIGVGSLALGGGEEARRAGSVTPWVGLGVVGLRGAF